MSVGFTLSPQAIIKLDKVCMKKSFSTLGTRQSRAVIRETQGKLYILALWLGSFTKPWYRDIEPKQKACWEEQTDWSSGLLRYIEFQGKILGRKKLSWDVPEFCIRHLWVLAEPWAVNALGRTLPGWEENNYWLVEIWIESLKVVQCSVTLEVRPLKIHPKNSKIKPQHDHVHLQF